jgi:hypothetical protein
VKILAIHGNCLQMQLKTITVFQQQKVRKHWNGLRDTSHMASLLVLLGFRLGAMTLLVGVNQSTTQVVAKYS